MVVKRDRKGRHFELKDTEMSGSTKAHNISRTGLQKSESLVALGSRRQERSAGDRHGKVSSGKASRRRVLC